jgi:hypothetical protein
MQITKAKTPKAKETDGKKDEPRFLVSLGMTGEKRNEGVSWVERV